jgi:hypothetical protein
MLWLLYLINFVLLFDRFCYPCAADLDPSTMQCELCPFTGGAYKPTFKTGKWAHSLCSQWIPETFITMDTKRPGNTEFPCLHLLNMDKKRFKLKCALCHSSKGACVQCCYGRCTTSVHPWCVLKSPQGFTKRVVVNPEGETVWEIFCKVHADAVSEPIKPKPKSKMSVPLPIEDAPSSNGFGTAYSGKKESKYRDSYSGSGGNANTGASSNSLASAAYIYGNSSSSNYIFSSKQLTMSHAKNFSASSLLELKIPNISTCSGAGAGATAPGSTEESQGYEYATYQESGETNDYFNEEHENDDDDESDEEDDSGDDEDGDSDDDADSDGNSFGGKKLRKKKQQKQQKSSGSKRGRKPTNPSNNPLSKPTSSSSGSSAAGTSSEAGALLSGSRTQSQPQTKQTTFPILNMLEWPGLSEGEAMDLDHFWNLVSGSYPEDHSPQVTCCCVTIVCVCVCVCVSVCRGFAIIEFNLRFFCCLCGLLVVGVHEQESARCAHA